MPLILLQSRPTSVELHTCAPDSPPSVIHASLHSLVHLISSVTFPKMAGRASVELHTLIFFKSRIVVADARVTKARASDPMYKSYSKCFTAGYP
jgi:hypothetical protein